MTVEESLKNIARQIMAMDEDSLIDMIPKYKKLMDNFAPTKEWEEAVIIYFLINGYRIKNTQFNERIKEYMKEPGKKASPKGSKNSKPDLHLIK